MEIKKIREMLPQGALKEVAEKAGVSSSAVTNYFKGRNKSYKIEIAAMEIAYKYETKRRELFEKLPK